MGFLTKSRGQKRKFKPPRFKSPFNSSNINGNNNKTNINNHNNQNNNNSNKNGNYEPPAKKRRFNSNHESPPNRFCQRKIDNNTNENNSNNKENINVNKIKTVKKSFKKPRRNSNDSPLQYEKQKREKEYESFERKTWSCFHCKRSNKKHKNYEDGILTFHDGKYLQLYDKDNGRKITQTLWKQSFQKAIDQEQPFFFGSKQVEIDQEIDNEEFDDGRCFNNNQINIINHNNNNIRNNKFKPISIKRNLPKNKNNKNKKFKIPTKRDSNGNIINNKKEYNNARNVRPITDPLRIKNPLVLNIKNLNKDYSSINKPGCDLRPVVVAKFLSEELRPHQREGIKFMYECIMGIKNGYSQNGVILADEMGLGKTLQCIVLIYTLINDGPMRNEAIKKCLIVVPASLVGNWYKEFNKWISVNRRGKCVVMSMDEKKKEKRDKKIESFLRLNSNKNILIIGYEMLRSYAEQIKSAKIGLIVCDEGHRLKNIKGNQTICALNKIKCNKRILLTGTPVQNDLSELYAMCSYINPNCLKDMNHFKNTFARPIEKSRDANCSKWEKITGDKRSNALNKITSSFILRRTSEAIMRKYLKPKDEYIVFHTLSSIQIKLYQAILNNKSVKSLISSHRVNQALMIIQYIKFCCSSPRLAYNKINASKSSSSPNKVSLKLPNKLRQEFANSLQNEDQNSLKMKILLNLIIECKKVGDKIVVVSNFTGILDVVEPILVENEFKFLRLDGSTPNKERTNLVTRFNKKDNFDEFIFLLSAKAGGVGLNLIGANRLVMLDPDWNPATDQQAMARIWRDGQTKKCKIYRLITIGSIEEKILQRQIRKLEVADSVVDRHGRAKHKHKDRHFTKDQLKEIFTLKTDIDKCETMDIIKENIKEWRICSNKHLIKTIIPTDNDKQIPVIFQRSIDPKTDPTSKWGIKINEDVMDESKDNDNDKDDYIDNDNIDDNQDFHDSDMDSDDEYQLKEISGDDDGEQDEDEEDDDFIVSDHEEVDDMDIDDESDLEIIKKKPRRKRCFDLDSDDDEDDEENQSPSRELKKKRESINSETGGNKEIENKPQQDIEEAIKEIKNKNKINIDDLSVDFGDDFDDFD